MDRSCVEPRLKRPKAKQRKKVIFHYAQTFVYGGKIAQVTLRTASASILFIFPCLQNYKIFNGKRFGTNEEVIAETDEYLQTIYKSFFKKGVEKLENRWNNCIAFMKETFMLMKKIEIYGKLISRCVIYLIYVNRDFTKNLLWLSSILRKLTIYSYIAICNRGILLNKVYITWSNACPSLDEYFSF